MHTNKEAKPETGTIKQTAWCAHCAEQIEKTKTSGGWYHTTTGEAEC